MPEYPEIPEELPLADVAAVVAGATTFANVPETTKENEAMIDIHVPQATHTWKDFWIHLGTITIGLLIAISLEQGVEKLHHLRQRHQLEEDLRAEAAKNIVMLDHNYRRIDNYMAWASELRDTVNAMHASGGKKRLPYPPRPDVSLIALTAPSSSAWTTAQASALVDLLPREEAKMYDRAYYELKLYSDVQEIRSEATRGETYFLARFAPVTLAPLQPNLSLMTVEQLDQFSALVTDDLIATRALRGRADVLCVAEKTVVSGSTSEDDILTNLNASNAVSGKSPAHDCSSQ
ncbi:MAG TPA: hypothetical protein VMQ60_08865 [Acidobacteriaceae bacterium]|jgi:hypothetical protein|nr:hypothetical protein [Acidobacteriaceae bacterium]